MPAFFCFLATVFSLLLAFSANGQKLSANNGIVKLYSKAPLSEIKGKSEELAGAINLKNRRVAFSVLIKSFDFTQTAMESQVNDRFLESKKHPKATFSGVIKESFDFNKAGTYPVTARGKLTIHGETRDRTIKGTLISDGNSLQLTSGFPVILTDHNIKIPRLLTESVTNEIAVDVRIKLLPEKVAQPDLKKNAK